MYKNNQYTKVEELITENKPKKAKKPVKKSAKKRKADSEEEESEEDEDDDEELTKKLTKISDKYQTVNHIVPNEIHHMGNPGDFRYSDFSYNLDDAQYIVANSDQVRVKYIVQIERAPK